MLGIYYNLFIESPIFYVFIYYISILFMGDSIK
jgi:hypothetical protein